MTDKWTNEIQSNALAHAAVILGVIPNLSMITPKSGPLSRARSNLETQIGASIPFASDPSHRADQFPQRSIVEVWPHFLCVHAHHRRPVLNTNLFHLLATV